MFLSLSFVSVLTAFFPPSFSQTVLSDEQSEYLGIPREGPFKPDQYVGEGCFPLFRFDALLRWLTLSMILSFRCLLCLTLLLLFLINLLGTGTRRFLAVAAIATSGHSALHPRLLPCPEWACPPPCRRFPNARCRGLTSFSFRLSLYRVLLPHSCSAFLLAPCSALLHEG